MSWASSASTSRATAGLGRTPLRVSARRSNGRPAGSPFNARSRPSRNHGLTLELAGVDVLAAPLKGGLIPALVESKCGFLRASTGQFEPWARSACASVTRLGSSVVFLDVSAAGRSFVEESAAGERVVETLFPDQRTIIFEVNEATGEALVGATDLGTGQVTLKGDSIQVITPLDWVELTPARLNPMRPVPLSADGRWLAYWNDGVLVIFDVREGTLTAVPSVVDAEGVGTLAWLE